MNPRPILIAICVAIALVAFVHFFGKQHFSVQSVDEPQPAESVTVAKSPSTNKAPSSTVNTDSLLEKSPNNRPRCPGCGEAFDPQNPGNHNSRMGSCFETHNGHSCIETNLWRCQHVHRFSDGTAGEAARYTSGPYKGMTYEQAQKVYEWRVRKSELQDRLIEHSKKSGAVARALVKSAEEELSLILSAFKLLPPEQLKLVRQEALKELPADDVKTFFDNLANSITMTPNQIVEAEIEMSSARKLLWIANDELDKEFEQLEKEIDEANKNYPLF